MSTAEPLARGAETGERESDRDLDKVRLRLVEVANDLRPLPTVSEMEDRVRDVAEALDDIVHDLMTVLHVRELEESDIESRLVEFDRKLAEGWRPKGRPADEVVADLRARAEKKGIL